MLIFTDLQIFDGPFEYETSDIRKLCGDTLPTVTWTTGNIMVVQFFADEMNPEPERGFNATYSHYSGRAAYLTLTR